jgi:flavin-binding protein dodecin
LTIFSGGEELAKIARRQRPELRVLLTLGYTEMRVGSIDQEGDEFPLIAKPYTQRLSCPGASVSCSTLQRAPSNLSRSSPPVRTAVKLRRHGTTGRRQAFTASHGNRHRTGRNRMDDHIYRVIQIVGSSEKSIDDAIQRAVSRASQTLRHLRWFEVVETRGQIDNGKIQHYQVTLKVGFTLDGSGED